MGFLKWVKNIFFTGGEENNDLDIDKVAGEESSEIREVEEPIKRSSLNIRNDEQRKRYIKNCCEQMQEAGDEIDKASMEYRLVTDYLKDIEVLDKLPAEVRGTINKTADRIQKLGRESTVNRENLGRISDEMYTLMERYDREIDGALEELRENEDYKGIVRGDLQRLESEKAVNIYERNELIASKENTKRIFMITIGAAAAVIIMLIVLYATAELDVRVGLLLAAAIAAAAFTGEYLSYTSAEARLRKVDAYINLVIATQNKVKIRYVNVSNLIEYSLRKFRVGNSNELEEYRDAYREEKQAREFLQRANSEIAMEKSHLVHLLTDIHLKDPSIWTRQCAALVDKREMVEIRHDLNTRRQSLRKIIEYNTKNRDISKDEINDIVRQYPEYGQEILSIVATYE
ncbi:MAG: hypothetical protein K5894_09155 [Lachnospiraceae bacterium]|nr:hypothetical protein [Lachnospiraceae bacterium]